MGLDRLGFYLAAVGVGTLGVPDFDTVDVTNLQRQILHTQDRIGMLKTQSANIALHAPTWTSPGDEYAEGLLTSESAPASPASTT